MIGRTPHRKYSMTEESRDTSSIGIIHNLPFVLMSFAKPDVASQNDARNYVDGSAQ